MLNLASVDGQCFQQGNAPGVSKVFAVLARQVVGSWPSKATIDEAECEVTEMPSLVQGASWVEYAVPHTTAKFDASWAGDPGYETCTHNLDWALASLEKPILKEIRKHLNAGSVFIVKDKNDNYFVVGSSDDPVFQKTKQGTTGAKGNDKKGFTLKGVADGMNWDYIKLSDEALADLVIQALPAPSSGPSSAPTPPTA